MRILITAGPTREYLDEVRFLSNASSGKMGYALAAAAVAAGHQVELVTGPVCLKPPQGCQVTAVESSQEMFDACERLFALCDGVIAAAAVTDYTPKLKAKGKIKKTGQGLTLELVETADVLAALGATKGIRWVVGFALEAQNPREGALRKLSTKHCDAIVLNRPSAIGSEDNRVELITANGQTAATWADSKSAIAKLLIEWIEANLWV